MKSKILLLSIFMFISYNIMAQNTKSLSLSLYQYDVCGTGGCNVQVASSSSWTATCGETWVIVEQYADFFTIDMPYPNTGEDDRDAIVTVSNNEGNTQTVELRQYARPNADFTTDFTSGAAPFEVNFTDNSTSSLGNLITGWSWDFGDGNTSNEENPTHIYETEDIYTVSLTVSTSTCNHTSTETKTDYITVGSPIPVCATNLRLLFPQNYATGMPQTIKLAWEKYPFDNLTYELLVKDGSQNTILSNNSLIDTYYQFEIGTMQYNQTYTWKVRALLSGSPISEWSEERQFTIKAETPASPAYGSALGHFNDAVIYKNNNNYTGNWQCVEYVKRYQNVVYGLNMPSIGNGNAYYWSSYLGFGRFENGGSEIPRIGDIVCHNGGTYGHVAIIRDVEFSDDGNNNNDWVYIAQQNVGSNIDNHVSQQVRLTYSNGNYTISNFVGLTVSGLRRAIPTVFAPQNNEVVTTTRPLIDWIAQPNASNYNIMLSIQNEETGCYEEVAGWSTVTTQDDYYIFPSGILESGNTYRFRVGVNFPFGGYVMTEPIYFEVSSSANSTPATASNSFVNTSSQNLLKSGKSETDTASNIAIYVNNDGYLIPKGFTNENGNLQFSATPELQVGDVIVAKGAGYETTEVELTDDMITSNNINITLQEIQTDNVTNPQIEVIDYSPIITNSEITVKFTAKNHTAFEILDHMNSNDTHTEFIHYSANDSIVNYTLTEFGSNEIFVRFLGEDTLYLAKTVIYNPDPAPEEYNTVTVISDANSIEANIYLNGEFLKTIENSTEEIIVPLGLQQFSFTKQGYINYFHSITETETINLELEAFIPTNIEITDNNLSNIVLYPNPANENVIIKLSEITENITINIYDFNGKLIKSVYANNQQDIELNISNFQTGVYYITIKSTDFVETKKLMIMK